MTTIAASLPRLMMAADSRVTIENETFDTRLSVGCTKIWRQDGFIVGCAGTTDDIAKFVEWLRDRRRRRARVKSDFEALMLSRTKLYHAADNGVPEEVRGGMMAIGSGGPFALASLTTQSMMGEDPDPALAVAVACHHDPMSREPIDFLTWKRNIPKEET